MTLLPLLAALALAGPPPGERAPEPSPTSGEQTQEAPVPQSQVTGTARNARSGAVIASEHQVVFVAGLEAWPDWALDREVSATGRLGSESYQPTGGQDADGAWTAGVPAGQTDPVLREASWGLSGTPPLPWRVGVSDGAGNHTWVTADPTALAWSYDPVRPEQSSSGIYSGGEPAKGALSAAQAVALWEQVRTLRADPSLHAERREKGTGQLTLETPEGRSTIVIRRAGFTELDAWVRSLRTGD